MPAVNTNPVHPLSPLQQGMLSHQSDRGAARVDLVQIVLHLPEDLPVAAFEQAWQWLAQRHAILRTAFHWHDPARPPVQEVQAAIVPEIAWDDWQTLDVVTREQWWEQLLERDRARGVDLTMAPLWRVTVVRAAPREHRVLFTFHHLLLDARALIVLFRELFAATESWAAGREPAAEPPVPYARYLDWLQEQNPEASAPYWREALAGFRTPTPLPVVAGAGLPKSEDARGPAERKLTLPAVKTAALQAFARAEGFTLNTLVQGVWALLLSRCSGEEDIVFGAVRACRHASVAGAENIVGLLINTVPLRVRVAPDARAADWLRDLRRQWTDLRAHEHVPLPSIRRWGAVQTGAPLFETVVSYQEPGWDAVLRQQEGAWSQRTFEVRNQTNYPLALDAAGGAALQLRISYDPARFTPVVIDRMLGHLATLLTGLAGHPAHRLAELPLLSAAERQLFLTDWNLRPADYDDELCVHHLFEQQAARAPGALAVADDHHRLTYGELNERATGLARRLHRLGVGPRMFVGVCLEPGVELVVALLAVLKAGGAYVPLDPAYPAERLAFLLREAGLEILVTQQKLAGQFPATAVRQVLVDGPGSEEPVISAVPPVVLVSSEHPAYLIYTSGSTGVPKGVSIRHRSLANLIAWHQNTYGVISADRASQVASPAFDACVWELWPYLTAGASIHIAEGDVRRSPARLVQWLADRRITLCFLPTPLAEATMDETWPAKTSLRAILTGGDRLRRWPGRRLPCPLVNHYGPTECTVLATWTVVPPDGDGQGAPAIGRPIANAEVYVLDRHRQLLPIGVPGELYLGGAGLGEGYHGRPDLTAEKFVPHPFDPRDGRKLYRTGDLVRWREDGQLDYLGRLDQQVKIRGHRIEPGEVEAALNQHPAVRECLVAAREDCAGQPQLVAYLLARPGVLPPEPAALAEFLHRQLPAYLVPAAYAVLESWPLTSHGKIDRANLPAPVHAQARGRQVIAPRPGIETVVAGVWSEVLGRGDLSACDDFFRLGGHSLRAAQVVSRLNAALNLTLSVRHLFDHSTIAGLAAAIEQMTPTDSPPLAPGKRELIQHC